MQAPLFTFKGFALAVLFSLLLCWPMILTGDVYVVSDSRSYIKTGDMIWQLLFGFFDPVDQTIANPLVDNGGGKPLFTRSIVYSVFAYPLVVAFGPVALALAQGTLVVFALFALVDREALATRWILVTGAVVVIVASSLPWRTVYLMPDVLGSIILIFAASLAGPFDRLTLPQKIVLTLLAAFATATHYGNVPLAGVICVCVLAWRFLAARLTTAVVLAAFVAVSVSPLLNAGASAVVLGEPTPTPLRLPILLARSISDGPAKWYLERECHKETWAICDAFDGKVPGSIAALLWDDDGIKSLSPKTVAQIRQEEYRLLFEVFRDYPVAQTASLVRNSALQIFRVGLSEIIVQGDFAAYVNRVDTEGTVGKRLLKVFDPVTKLVTLISSLIILCLAVLGRLSRSQLQLVLAVAAGLLVNAMVFGGLSAPVDRYQSRVAWLISAILVILLAQLGQRYRLSIDAPKRCAGDVH